MQKYLEQLDSINVKRMDTYLQRLVGNGGQNWLCISDMIDQVQANMLVEEEEKVNPPISPDRMCWKAILLLQNCMTMKDIRSSKWVETSKIVYGMTTEALSLLLRSALLGSVVAVECVETEINSAGLPFLTATVPAETLDVWKNERTTTDEINTMLSSVYREYTFTQHRYKYAEWVDGKVPNIKK